jgi:hypothetical protein
MNPWIRRLNVLFAAMESLSTVWIGSA